MEVRTTAKVKVELELDATGWWTEDTTVAQVHRQATADAIQRIRSRLKDESGLRILSTNVTATAIAQPPAAGDR